MTLIHDARTAFLFAQGREIGLAWTDAVSVRLECIGGFRKCVAERGVNTLMSSKADLCLPSVVVGDAEIDYSINLPDAAIDRQYWSCQVSGCNGPGLTLRITEEGDRRIQIHRAVGSAEMLMYKVAANKKPFEKLVLIAHCGDLASGIYKLVRIIWQHVKIKSIPSELCLVKAAHAGPDSDVALR